MLVVFGFVIFFVLAGIISAIVGCGIRIRSLAGQIRDAERLDDPNRLIRSMKRCSLICFLLGLYFAALAMGGSGVVFWPLMLGTLLLLAASLLLSGVRLVRNDELTAHRRNRNAKFLESLGTLILISPALMVGSWPIILVLILLAIAGIHLIAGKRRVDQGTVLWTLAIATQCDLPITEELDTIANSLSGKQRRRANRLAGLLQSGVALDEALEQTPGVVPHFAVLAARVGSQNGNLAESLRDAAMLHSSREKQHQVGGSSLTLSLFYLTVVPLIALLILSSLMVYIVPKFKEIFEGFDTELPAITVRVIDLTELFELYTLGAVLLVGFLTVIVWLTIAYCRGWGENDILFGGKWFRRLDVPGLLRNLAATVSAGGSLEESLGILAQSHRRTAVRKSLTHVHSQCVQGGDCWQAMYSVGLLTERDLAVVKSARRAGNLPWALSQLAVTIEKRIAYRWVALLEFVQPAFILLLGLGVGVLSAAFFLPLLKLVNDLS